MESLTLRGARPDDSEFAYRTMRAALRGYVEQVWGWDEAEQWKLYDRRFEAHDVRIISIAGSDVGVMAIAIATDCMHLHQLFILPEHQGRGIGRRCMLLILEEARRLGLPVRLRVLKINPRALAFYERLGFARTGETETHYLLEKRW
jgi:GNAT superfamily N-acetyltransferase